MNDFEKQVREQCDSIATMLIEKNAALLAVPRGRCAKHPASSRLEDGRCRPCYQKAWKAKQRWIARTPGAKEVVRQNSERRKEASRERARRYQRALRLTDEHKLKEKARAASPRRKAAHRARVLRQNYGITPADYAALCVKQGNRCALCKTDTPTGRGQWHVDHDHATGEVRGLLCSRCNTGLGLFDDDKAKLRAAIRYLGGGK